MEGFILLIFIIVGCIACLLWLYYCFKILPKQCEKAAEKNKIEKKRQEEQKEQEARDLSNAKKIYKRCMELNITQIDQFEQQKNLMVVASSFDEMDIEKAKKLYILGAELIKKEQEQKEKIKLENIRKKENEIYDKQKEEADRGDRSKYTYVAEYHKAMDALNKAMNAAKEAGAYNMIKAQPSSQDWAFWGGVASGLGGGAVGLATAAQIQQENARAENEAQATRERGWMQLKEAREEFRNYKKLYTLSEKEQEEYVNSRLFDASNPYEKLELLNFEKTSLHITKGKNFIFQGTIRCENLFKLLDKPSVLDGSVKINVKNSKGSVVGTGYFSAPGAGMLDLRKVGFYDGITFQSLCLVKDYTFIEKNQTYTYEIEPNHLWLIEL